MTHVKFRTATLSLALMGAAACTTQPLPATTTYEVNYVGTWHAVQADDPKSFDDYVFGSDGTLTTLRSVKDGVTVNEMAGAGLVHNAQSSIACAFGEIWRSDDANTLVVDGKCTDDVARDIELGFLDQSVTTAQVSVRAVAHEASWMQPTSWLFQSCDLHACD